MYPYLPRLRLSQNPAFRRICLLCLPLWLSACSTLPSPDDAPRATDRRAMQAPSSPKLSSPNLRLEPPSRSGNRAEYRVRGRTYKVWPTSAGYREQGLASWYGPGFHGRKTASGQRYNMHELSAAHRSLPLPSYVQVTNLHNGRHIIVRVNDRGPFVGDERIIDLSYGAARALGMVNTGVARVEVVALPPYQRLKSPRPAVPPRRSR